MKKIALTAAIAMLAIHVSGDIVAQWTFDGPNPETSANGLTMDVWTTGNKNSVPSEGVLRYETPGNGSSVKLGLDASTITQLKLTVEVTDIKIGTDGSTQDQVVFQIFTDAGKLELEVCTYKNNLINIDLESGIKDEEKLDVDIVDQDKFPGQAIPLVMTATWDLKNQTMTFAAEGAKKAWVSIPAPNLANISKIYGFRTKAMMDHGTFLDLDTVTLETE